MELSQNTVFNTSSISRFGIGCHKLYGGLKKNDPTI